MRQYHSDNKNYNAILDAMAQIRQNQLNESNGYFAEEDDEEQMQEAMHGHEEEMEEAYMYEEGDEEEQMNEEGDITPEEAEELGALIDDVLAEEFEEDDLNESISLEEADKNKKSKVRSFLKGVALAGLLGAGGTAMAYGLGTDPGAMSAPGAPVRTGMQRALSRIGSGYGQMGSAALTGIGAAGQGVADAAGAVNTFGRRQAMKTPLLDVDRSGGNYAGSKGAIGQNIQKTMYPNSRKTRYSYGN